MIWVWQVRRFIKSNSHINFFSIKYFLKQGCKQCECNPIGSFDSPPLCDPISGFCRCKENVESRNCDRPKPGFFNLAAENMHGALPCYCYGHSSQCDSATGYFMHNLTLKGNSFAAYDSRGNRLETQAQSEDAISVNIPNLQEDVYFLVSTHFLGNQIHSYNQGNIPP